jgi:polyisoprenyl-teichoic acid--peptidoglycan teichoic acid transferase
VRVGVGRSIALLLALVFTLTAACSGGGDEPDVVIGSTRRSTTTAPAGPTIPVAPETTLASEAAPVAAAPVAASAPAADDPLKNPDGQPYAGAIAFRSTIPVSPDLTFVLVIGSDARPGEDIRRTNGDSIHLLAVNPRTGQGTVLGLPRDSYVDIPGRGRAKINSALASGGPGLMAEAVRRLTGLPVHYYVLTGFAGLASMVDSLGGVDVRLERAMNDRVSGARFAAGFHHFNGAQALAFTRNRNDVPNGDFGRSANQGTLILAALAKMRAEVGDDGGLRRWVDVLLRHAALDVAPDRLLGLAALARGLDPANLRNVVAPGRIGMAGRQSVVYLAEDAARMFVDLRDDAVVNGGGGAVATGGAPGPAPATGPPGASPAPVPGAPALPPEPTTTTTRPLIDLRPLFPGR